jgi:hypothetical protein
MRNSSLAAVATVAVVLGVATPLTAQAAPVASRSVHAAAHPVTNAAAHPAARASKRPPRSAVLYGLDDTWESQVEADDRQNSAKSGIVGTFLTWRTKASSIVNYAKWANGRGSVPMLDLYPPTNVSLASIAAGHEDSWLVADAKALHRWNHAFLFRLFPEMNGPWESYSPGTHGQTASQFVAAWRHVYRVFRSHHAKKVRFVWNPDKMLSHQAVSFRSLWPGKRYVNWVGLDVFNSADSAHGSFPSPRSAVAPSVRAVRRLTKTKPLIIPEMGTAQFSGKPSWIRTALSRMHKLGFKAVVWYNKTGKYPDGGVVDWRLDSSIAALRATRRALASNRVVWPGHNGGRLHRDAQMVLRGHW